MSQKTSLRKQAFTTCTLKDLCPEDKQKVAQLVRQVVELGKENQQLKATAATATTAEAKLRQIQDCNKQAVKENCNLKNKLGQAITVLRMYHHKVRGLDAALRALQHEAPSAEAGTQQQQQDACGEQQVCETPALPLPAPQTAEEQQQQLEQADAKAGTTADQQAASLQQQEGSPGGQCHMQQQQQQQQGPLQQTPGAAASTAGQTPANSPSHYRCCLHASGAVQQQLLQQQQQQQQMLLNSQLCSVLQGSHILPGSSLSLGLPLHQMQAWQLQDRHLLAEQQPRTVLQFDPSIGSCGAYVVQQLPEPPLHLMHSSTPAPAAHSTLATPPAVAASAAAGAPGYQQESPCQAAAVALGAGQQQREGHVVSAGGAATAAAAAAASSALAAVKAAAAMCAAPTWQPGLSSCSISSSPRQGHSQHPAAAAAAMNGGMVDSRGVDGQGPGAYEAGSWRVAAVPAESQQDPEAGAAVEEVPVFDVASGAVHVLVQNEKSASSLHQAHARVTLAGGMGVGAASPAASSVLPSAVHPVATSVPSEAAAAAAQAAAGGTGADPRYVDGKVLWQPQDSQDAWQSDSSRRAQQQQQQAADLQRFWMGTDGRDQPGQVQQWVRQQQQQQEAEAFAAQHSFMGSSVSPAGASQHLAQQQQQQPGWTQPMPAVVGPSSHPGQAAAAGNMPTPALMQPQHQQQQAQPQRQRRTQPPAYQVQSQQQLQGYALDGVATVDSVSGTRQLLLKFDESLLDILAEVERLEQQQQRARQQLQGQQEEQHTHQPYPQLPQQQQKQRLPKLPLQARQQQQQQQRFSPERQAANGTADEGWPARQVTAAAGGLSVSAAGRSQQAYLSHKQAQLQQRIQQLQQEGPPLGRGLSAAAAWEYQGPSVDYDDDVSDILNHLD